MDEFNNTLLSPLLSSTTRETKGDLYIGFLNRLEGWKTKCKNLHWAAVGINIHVYLDSFLDVISDYQDGLAEGYMGILGKMRPDVIKGVECDSLNAIDFIEEVKAGTLEFYRLLPTEPLYKGITSECETFIQNITKYTYLFKLCHVNDY